MYENINQKNFVNEENSAGELAINGILSRALAILEREICNM